MSDMLLGKEVSGTPVETRGGTRMFSEYLQNMMRQGPQGTGQQFNQLATDALMSLLATPQIAGLLTSPADQTSGLFASMVPFERQQTADQVAGVRNIFGSVGGRFSRNVADAESRTRGELGNQFARARQEALLTAQGQNQNFMANLLQAAQQRTQNSLLPLQVMAQFFQGGAPQFQQGILPGLISAGSSLYTAKSLFGGQQPTGVGSGPSPAFMRQMSQPLLPSGNIFGR